jgi:hypothetical protein
MVAALAIIIVIGVTLLSYSQIRGLWRNIAAAKSSGFKYFILPTSLLSIPWVLAQPLLLPILDHLPESWTERWLPYE